MITPWTHIITSLKKNITLGTHDNSLGTHNTIMRT